jgi:hypothetical protein
MKTVLALLFVAIARISIALAYTIAGPKIPREYTITHSARAHREPFPTS